MAFPRNILQAENLNHILKKYDQKISLVLKLSVSLELIKKRISGRSVCLYVVKSIMNFLTLHL